jgi:hypothetical protein
MSQLCGMLKNPAITWKSDCLAKFGRPFITHTSSFRSQRSLMAWSASGDEWRNQRWGVRVQTASKAEVRLAEFPPAPPIEGEEVQVWSSKAATPLSLHKWYIGKVNITVTLYQATKGRYHGKWLKLFKIFLRVFCTVIIRCTETFWSPCTYGDTTEWGSEPGTSFLRFTTIFLT